MTSYRTFVLRKIHSLAGVIPLGVFLFVHMTLNSFAAKGEQAYNAVIAGMRGFPNIWAYEWMIIFIPLIFHGVYGLWVWWTGESNVSKFGYYRNWMYTIQRIAGIFAFAFLAFHILVMRFGEVFFGLEVISFAEVNATFSDPLLFAIYWVGLISAIFHFANGIFTFCITWGIAVGPKTQRLMEYVVWILFLGLSAYGTNMMLAFLGKNIF